MDICTEGVLFIGTGNRKEAMRVELSERVNDCVFSFVYDSLKLLILYIETSSMQLDIRSKIQEEDIG